MAEIFLTVVTYLLLGIIAYEDFRFRAVHIWIFPALVISVLLVQGSGFNPVHTLFNMFFMLVQCMALTTYFSWKEKRFVNITRKYLGWGDILLWLVLCLWFSPINYQVFYLCSLLITAMIAIVLRVAGKGSRKIPLAGIQAMILLAVEILNICVTHINFRDDYFIENILTA